jgi:hypothetical protein
VVAQGRRAELEGEILRVFRQRNGLGDGEEEEEDDDDDGVPARWQIVDGESRSGQRT